MFRFLALLVTVGVSLTFAVPATTGFKNWDELLLEDGIFDDDVKMIGGNSNDDENVLFQLKTLVNQRDFLERVYIKWARHYDNTQVLEGDLSRIDIFKQELLDVAKHNLEEKKGLRSYNVGINQFSDMTSAEFYTKYSSPVTASEYLGNSSVSYKKMAPLTLDQQQQLPETVDWKARGKVTSIKNQGQTCNSCASFASTALLESAWAIIHGTDAVSLSAQQVLDCEGTPNVCPTYMINGQVADYVKNHGVVAWDDYPYESAQGVCRVAGKKPIAQASDWSVLADSSGGPLPEETLQLLLTVSPVWVIICHEGIKNYEGSKIFEGECGCKPFHFVVVVGYGVRDGVDYWLIKNSWGEGWGDKGYLWLRRNYNRLCSVTNAALVMEVANSV